MTHATANLERLADMLLAPRTIERDAHGFVSHPALPLLDESVDLKQFLIAFGVESALISMESDCGDQALIDRYYEGGSDCAAFWKPDPPRGDGWVLLEVFDTEDTPHALFARRQPARTTTASGEKPVGMTTCPITGRPFWGNLEHPDVGLVAVYGGPFDSFTVPAREDDGELRCERFDQDEGHWVEGGEPSGWFYEDQQEESEPVTPPQPTAVMPFPVLNEDLINILGRPNFACIHMAQLLRANGQDIKTKAENEQAAVIHFLLRAYLEHGAAWAETVDAELDAMAAALAGRQQAGGAA